VIFYLPYQSTNRQCIESKYLLKVIESAD